MAASSIFSPQPFRMITNPNPTLFRSGSGDESYSRGQWDTALRATPPSPKGDVLCGQCLRAPCTLKCPRLPVSPPSLIARAMQVLSDYLSHISRRLRRLSPLILGTIRLLHGETNLSSNGGNCSTSPKLA